MSKRSRGGMTPIVLLCLVAGCHGHEKRTVDRPVRHGPSHSVPDPDLIFPPAMRHIDRSDVRQMAPYARALDARDAAAAKAEGASAKQIHDERERDAVLAALPRERREQAFQLMLCRERTPTGFRRDVDTSALLRGVVGERDLPAAIIACRAGLRSEAQPSANGRAAR